MAKYKQHVVQFVKNDVAMGFPVIVFEVWSCFPLHCLDAGGAPAEKASLWPMCLCWSWNFKQHADMLLASSYFQKPSEKA